MDAPTTIKTLQLSRFLFLVGIWVTLTAPLHASDIDITHIMTPEEQARIGISKLSKQEINALNDWLMHFTASKAPLLLEHNATIRAIQNTDISAGIVGAFNGWAGETLFKLDNGQVWKQRTPGKWRTRRGAARVHITQNALGFWEMQIEGTQRSIGVKRIK